MGKPKKDTSELSASEFIRQLARELKQARRALEYYANHGDKRKVLSPSRARRVLLASNNWDVG